MRTSDVRRALTYLCLADVGQTDGQLLTRFLDAQDEAAFAALVRRHGPMVLGVCRRVIGHVQDAEDAFQATFLVLARKARSVSRREAVASFLYAVAYRTALRARTRRARRGATERQVTEMPHPSVAPTEAQDWIPVLDRELSRLPEKYRAVLVLCDLEGKTRREAARQLKLPEGTLSSRLATARRMLAGRLAKCGVSLSGGALAVALAEGASAAVPPTLVGTTAQAAALVAAGKTSAAPAVLLMNEVLRAMLITKLKLSVVVLLAVMLIAAGGATYQAAGGDPQPTVEEAPRCPRPMTELESLRREVELLKAQVQLTQAKVRTLEELLRLTQRERAKGLPGAPPAPIAVALPPLAAEQAVPLQPGAKPYHQFVPPPPSPRSTSLPPGGASPGTIPTKDLARDLEVALQTWRAAQGDAERQLALDLLAKSLESIRRATRDQQSEPSYREQLQRVLDATQRELDRLKSAAPQAGRTPPSQP